MSDETKEETSASVTSNIETVKAFNAGLRALCKQLGIASVVAEIDLDGRMAAAVWLPGCTDTCERPELCAAKNFAITSKRLMARAVEMSNGEMEGMVFKTGRESGFLN
jgi:hypothetical protein